MTDFFSPRLKKFWDKWIIRGVIMLSLILQTILIFFAPSRRRTAKKLFLVLIWSAYLLADWAADYAVGQISDSQEEEADSNNSKTRELLAFWSPFLLLHLGGPDTITALALEDNQLWDRHLFSLVCQAIATVYVLLLSIPNRLLIPTVIMLVGGVIKYVERTAALFSASLDKFKDAMLQDPDPGANYAKLMKEYTAKKEMNMPTNVIMMEEDPEKGREGNLPIRPKDRLTHLQIVQYAYKYFNIFKGLIVDLIFTNKQRDESREFFDKLSPEEALSIIEVELGLIYDCLFTKAEILHNWTGVVFRFTALGCLVSSLCLFKMTKKDQYHGFDVALTYALLICGIALDSIALLMFSVSDWTIARLRDLKEDFEEPDSWPDRVLNWVLSFRAPRWTTSLEDGHEVLNRNFMLRRWSEYLHAYNLIGFCLGIRPKRIHHTKGKMHSFFDKMIHILYIDIAIDYATRGITLCFGATEQGTRVEKKKKEQGTHSFLSKLGLFPLLLGRLINYVIDFFGVKDLLEDIRFTVSDRLTKQLWEFIFEEVKQKHRFAEDPESAKGISSARGNWTLVETSSKKTDEGSDHAELLQYVTEKDYDQSILLWHIATELVYQSQPEEEKDSNKELSKILSDYMMYLLMMQPTLMSAVSGIAKIRFRDTCAEAEEFFKRRSINKSNCGKKNLMKEASDAILSVDTTIPPMNVKGDRSKSVLFDASVLAKELKKLNSNKMWQVMSKVWVELLCYAATHCDSQEHASQLSKGGELINFVWLLMAHFGLGDQFQINRDDGRAKLIVAK
ncbi:hypothetical protein V5N11_025600 [Cardamine amara subsp. amara]|uniref:DUF4220 domain-containing protein n=1 Tax=Cardamine amara subsp. amara TaxID=228776 RepID=A0ABD1C949_CARAN